MSHHYLEITIAIIYLIIGLLGYSGASGVGAELEPAKKPSFLRRILVILFWPLAMIGAIES